MKLILLMLLMSFHVFSQELNNNETVSFELNAETMSTGLYVQIPTSATTLKVETSNDIPGSNFELFMKYGSDFTSTDLSDISQESDYRSTGTDSHEYFTISSALNKPLKNGKWYIAVFNNGSSTESINLSISYNNLPLEGIEIIFITDEDAVVGTSSPCEIEGWNDPTPFTPISGNNATTLGEARRNAAAKAIEILAENLQSTTPLIIQGCWLTTLYSTPTQAVVSAGQSLRILSDTPGLIPDTWYQSSIVERQAGTHSCKVYGGNCNSPSMLLYFNPKVDTPAALSDQEWYYGIDSSSPNQDLDFISNMLHSITHNLGFQSLLHLGDDYISSCTGTEVNITIGSIACGKIDIFSSFLLTRNNDDTLTLLSELATDQDRATAITSPNRLLWNSEETASSEFNTQSNNGLGLVQMHSPAILSQFDSVSHFSSRYSELMDPTPTVENSRSLGLAKSVLWDIGWDPRAKVSYPQPGLYFDRSRSGHGFVIEPIANTDLYFTVFYTYKADGTPEWYTSLAVLEDNILNVNMDSNTLQRFTYDYDIDPTGGVAPNIADTSVGTNILKIDFNKDTATAAAACNDGVERTEEVALATWQLGTQQDTWCIDPLVPLSSYPTPDFGGTWYTGIDDSGWGLSISYFADTIIVTIYYYDPDGNARWVQGLQSGFEVGEEITVEMKEFTGFARDATPIVPTSVLAGMLTLTLNANNGDDNDGELTLNLDYQGDNSSTTWSRDNVPVLIFTEAH